MSSSNSCFLTFIRVSQETGKVVWYSLFFKNFPQFVVIHTVKGFSVVNIVDVFFFLFFLESSCFFYDPTDAGNLVSGSSAFSKSSLYIWKFLLHLLLKHSLNILLKPSLNGSSGNESHSAASDSLQYHGLYNPQNSLGQNIGVGSLSLLQGIFLMEGLNLGLFHYFPIIYQLSHKGNPRIMEWVDYPFSSRSSQPRNQTGVSCIAGSFFINWAIREALVVYGV